MEILNFIFGLGIAFSIFGFLWGIIMLVINLLRRDLGGNRNVQDYGLRIIKYFLLVSVTANYMIRPENGTIAEPVKELTTIILGVLVLGIYLLGKLQNRTMLSQLAANPMFARFANKIDPKVERFLLIGSLIYFVACLLYPQMVNNSIVNWFTKSILAIYDTPVIGWIFAIIAFFFLVNTIFKSAGVIGAIVTGQPINPPNQGGGFQGNFGGSNPFDQFRDQQSQSEDFVDYEDVTDEDEADSDESKKNKLT